MRITNALREEHKVFFAMFDELDQLINQGADLARIRAKTSLLAKGLLSHAHIENDILFPPLESDLGGMGPIATMKAEHEEIEGGLLEIANVREAEDAREMLKGILELARQHFAKEDEILFPMADEILDESALNELGSQLAERRRAEPLASA